MSPASCSAWVETSTGAFPILGKAITEMIAMTTITMTTSVSVNPLGFWPDRWADMVSSVPLVPNKRAGALRHPPLSEIGSLLEGAAQQLPAAGGPVTTGGLGDTSVV